MKSILYSIVLGAFLFANTSLQAQITVSVVGLINFPDTIVMYQPFNYDVIVKNENLQMSFIGDLGIVYQTSYMDSLGIPADSGFFSIMDTIAPGDFDTINIINFQANPSEFKTGDNAILIWPIINGVSSGDTITKDVYVFLTSGIKENFPTKDAFQLYPNPAYDYIYIVSKNHNKSSIEKVRIYNILGKNILGNLTSEMDYEENTPIDIHNLPQGTYIVEIRLHNGNKVFEKLVKK